MKQIEFTHILGIKADQQFFKGQFISIPMKDGGMDVYKIVKMKHGRTWVKPQGIIPLEDVRVLPEAQDKPKWKNKTK